MRLLHSISGPRFYDYSLAAILIVTEIRAEGFICLITNGNLSVPIAYLGLFIVSPIVLLVKHRNFAQH
jgi:ABC-type tungstate transport system substrate-binding protein